MDRKTRKDTLAVMEELLIVLVERYQGPAGCITARQRWRLDPIESATRLSVELRIRTNQRTHTVPVLSAETIDVG